MKVALLYTGLVLIMVCSGCKVGPQFTQPDINVPKEFSTVGPNSPLSKPANVVQWWTKLNDPMLNSLITEVNSSNLELKVARARVLQARARRGIVAADQYPNVTASGTYQRSRSSANTLFGRLIGGKHLEDDLYQVGFDATWEVDLFGSVSRRVEAADADVKAAVASERDVMISVLAEVARNYIDLRGFQRALEIANKNVTAQRETLDVVQARYKAGLTSELDIEQAKAQLQQTRSQIPLLETSLNETMHRLAILLGQQPGALKEKLAPVAPIPPAGGVVPVGLPSELLTRRPDVKQAEQNLAAATARIGVATADLFPRFSLTGSFGLQSDASNTLFESPSRIWSIGPSFSWPVFDAGRIRANIRLQNAFQEEAMARYINTVLTSLEDVENALVAYGKEQERLELVVSEVASNRRSVELANELYNKGLVDFLNVLVAQQRLYISEEALVLSEKTVATNLVALYKALGGGW